MYSFHCDQGMDTSPASHLHSFLHVLLRVPASVRGVYLGKLWGLVGHYVVFWGKMAKSLLPVRQIGHCCVYWVISADCSIHYLSLWY